MHFAAGWPPDSKQTACEVKCCDCRARSQFRSLAEFQDFLVRCPADFQKSGLRVFKFAIGLSKRLACYLNCEFGGPASSAMSTGPVTDHRK